MQLLNDEDWKSPLRIINRKDYIVTPLDVIARAAKPKMYTEEEKTGFSTKNSMSVNTPDALGPIFGGANRNSCLAGVLFTKEGEEYLSGGFYSFYDVGTYFRPNEFSTWAEANTRQQKFRVFVEAG